MTAASVQADLAAVAVKPKADSLARFFKTGPGQYAEGDLFIGVAVPNTRAVSRNYRDLPLEEIYILLESEIHEHRLAGLVILTYQYKKAKTERLRAELFDFYLTALYDGRINNWDLIDVTAPTFGEQLIAKPKAALLTKLAKSDVLWERRCAIMFTFAHIRAMQFEQPIRIAKLLLHDEHDLIHKAVGWMLREVGNRDLEVLRSFLVEHHSEMPRTMLRYAIEKLSPDERKKWMAR